MEIIQNFGLDPLLVVAQIVNFLILVYLLNRFFFKKVLNYLKAREEKIRVGLEAAQKGEQLLEKAKVSRQEILNTARGEASLLLQNVQKSNIEIAKIAREKAKAEADKIIAQARKQALEEVARLQQELSKQTARIAMSILEKTLQGFLSIEEQKKIMTKLFLHEKKH